MPLVVPPSPTKCFAQAATFFLQKQERKKEKKSEGQKKKDKSNACLEQLSIKCRLL
jgi:hypothetical protein